MIIIKRTGGLVSLTSKYWCYKLPSGWDHCAHEAAEIAIIWNFRGTRKKQALQYHTHRRVSQHRISAQVLNLVTYQHFWYRFKYSFPIFAVTDANLGASCCGSGAWMWLPIHANSAILLNIMNVSISASSSALKPRTERYPRTHAALNVGIRGSSSIKLMLAAKS